MNGDSSLDPTLSVIEKILHLRRQQMGDLSTAVSAAQLSVIADQMRDRSFKAGSVLLREGEAPASAFSIVRGRVRVSRRGATLGEVGPGAAVAMGAIVSRDTLGLGAIAATDVFALELDRDVLIDIFDDHFPILLEAIRDAAGRHLALIRTMSQIPKQLPRVRREPPPPADRLDLVERLLYLKAPGGPFERSALDALAEVAERARQRTIEPGTILWNEGEHAGGGCLLVSGTLACSTSTDNGPVTFRVEPGAAVGALEAMAGQPRWHNAVAETRSDVLEYDVDDLIDVIEDNVDMGTDFLSWVSSDALNLIERVYGPGPELLYFLTTSQAMSDPE